MSKNIWQWESLKIELTDPKGNTVVLNSGNLGDYILGELSYEIKDFVESQGGELA
jgi:hypothetical protein